MEKFYIVSKEEGYPLSNYRGHVSNFIRNGLELAHHLRQLFRNIVNIPVLDTQGQKRC